MTCDEIEERRRKERAFDETPIGKAFNRYKNTQYTAIRKDAESEYLDNIQQPKLQRLWAEATEAEKAFRAELDKLMQRFDATADFAGSLNESYRAIRERVASGGPAWNPKEPGGDRG
jgi:hypothetical protein